MALLGLIKDGCAAGGGGGASLLQTAGPGKNSSRPETTAEVWPVALARGAVPELVRSKVTGLVCERSEELPDALRAAHRHLRMEG
ncbi:hypothetical protein [Micromonospora zamorensis]|uniref:hypothetical protein n=1 Tax=Micromonospora zamorensis TaxID=709883 RepID=UPI0034071C6E